MHFIREALLKNAASIKDTRVLDIGCGTGILSMFSAEAGASAVVGVDCSDIIYQAMDIVRVRFIFLGIQG